MYNYQSISKTTQYGGMRVVLTGTNYNLLAGNFKVALDRLPDIKNGIIPATTPVFADEVERTIDYHFAFEVYEAATATSTKIKVKKGYEGSRVQVGMVIMAMPDTIDGVGKSLAVTAVDMTNEDHDIITVATGGLGVALSIGDTIVEADKVHASDAKIKVLPNGILPYDMAKDPYADFIHADCLFNQVDGVLLENRVPPIADIIKQHMREQDVYLRYSKSIE